MKSTASEMLMILAVLASVGIALIQLQKISIQGISLLQSEPLSIFGNEIESILKQFSASTAEYAYYVYQPPLILYEMNITENNITILDKKTNKTFSIDNVFGFDFEKNSFDDAKNVYIVKNHTRVLIFGSCKNIGESCEFHLQCCENYCWGDENGKSCRETCAPLGAYAASPNDCCSGYLNESHQCDNPKVCPDTQICSKATENTYKDDLGHTCCIDGYVCSYDHCCPEDKPYWCEKPKTGDPRCMDESEYNNNCDAYCKYPCTPNCKLPPKWDWRNVNGKNYLTPVRAQKLCGACWAFSTVGALEGKYKVEHDCSSCNIDLSEQNLISPGCNAGAGSCNGGLPSIALHYIKVNGIVDESCFPYTSYNCEDPYTKACLCPCPSGGCSKPCECNLCSDYLSHRFKINEFHPVKNNIDDVKRALICHGPLIAASMNWGHAIVLVGYDDNSDICMKEYGKKGCWIIKNSWGVINRKLSGVYHENGYGYIPYEGFPYSDLINYVIYVEGVHKWS